MHTQMSFSKNELEQMVASVPAWWHSIELGHGVKTKGVKAGGDMTKELESLHLPDFRHKTVLDIGANDGFYSFEAERRGASRVLSVDYYAWSLDLAKHWQYQKDCKERGVVPEPDQQTPNWRPSELPGKRGFDTAHKALSSKVEAHVGDYLKLDPKQVGSFDIVLYLGVLYHMEDLLQALKQVAALTREVAVIETAAVVIPGYEHHALCEFFETSELDGDMSNWWAPNEKALVGMCRAAGFRRVEVIAGAPLVKEKGKGLFSSPPPVQVHRYRAIVHAFK
jgi:tRNA (mo5U34)-methyltransferase